MRYLAIETSCDETSVAVFDDRKVLYHKVYSQIRHHKIWKGVVPEIASRLHSQKISFLLKDARIEKLDSVGFVRGPGLKGSLLIGKVSALIVGEYCNASVIGINHLEGHLLSCDLDGDYIKDILKFPLIALIVSGGHSELWYCEGYGRYKLIGKTRDDACGEAFDKVARIIGLGYPGGPQIEHLAKKAKEHKINFTVPNVEESFDYSFSGIKTQVLYYVNSLKKIDQNIKSQIAWGFQKAVCESLVNKMELAVNRFKVRNIAVCGGVSANSYLRNIVKERFYGFNIFFPQICYTTDNAAMIGVCMFRRFQKGRFRNSIDICDSLGIESWVI